MSLCKIHFKTKYWLLLMWREHVCRLPTRCVSSTQKKITVVLGLKSRVVSKTIENRKTQEHADKQRRKTEAMSRARHHHRLWLHFPASGKFFLIPRFPLHYNSFATVAVNYNSLDTIAVNYNSFVPRTRLLLGRVTGLSQWPGWTSWVQPNPYELGQTQPHPKKKTETAMTGPGQFVLGQGCIWQKIA